MPDRALAPSALQARTTSGRRARGAATSADIDDGERDFIVGEEDSVAIEGAELDDDEGEEGEEGDEDDKEDADIEEQEEDDAIEQRLATVLGKPLGKQAEVPDAMPAPPLGALVGDFSELQLLQSRSSDAEASLLTDMSVQSAFKKFSKSLKGLNEKTLLHMVCAISFLIFPCISFLARSTGSECARAHHLTFADSLPVTRRHAALAAQSGSRQV